MWRCCEAHAWYSFQSLRSTQWISESCCDAIMFMHFGEHLFCQCLYRLPLAWFCTGNSRYPISLQVELLSCKIILIQTQEGKKSRVKASVTRIALVNEWLEESRSQLLKCVQGPSSVLERSSMPRLIWSARRLCSLHCDESRKGGVVNSLLL